MDIDAIVEELRSFSFAGFTVDATVEEETDSLIAVRGHIYDSSGEEVGHYDRHFANRDGAWEVHHEGLYLDPGIQGRGFGTAFQRESEEVYERHGVDQISMFAQEVGSYAWHNFGYHLAGTPEVRQKQCAAIWNKHGGRDRARAALDAGRIDQSLFDATNKLFEAIAHGQHDPVEPDEIAAIGREIVWTENTRKMWLGKTILINSQWTGVKSLVPTTAEP